MEEPVTISKLIVSPFWSHDSDFTLHQMYFTLSNGIGVMISVPASIAQAMPEDGESVKRLKALVMDFAAGIAAIEPVTH